MKKLALLLAIISMLSFCACAASATAEAQSTAVTPVSGQVQTLRAYTPDDAGRLPFSPGDFRYPFHFRDIYKQLISRFLSLLESTYPNLQPPASPTVISTRYYTLTLPASWSGRCSYEIYERNDGTYNLNLFEITSLEACGGGTLCSLSLFPAGDDSYLDIPAHQLLAALNTPEGSFSVIAIFPTDVQYTDRTAAAYQAMYSELNDVLRTIHPAIGTGISML